MYIELKNVTKKIRGVTVLDNVSLRMESGNIYGFKGKNGSGKTMLMRAVAGLIRVDGIVDINGKIMGKDMMFPDRSEERRVGKECRSRWSPYH